MHVRWQLHCKADHPLSKNLVDLVPTESIFLIQFQLSLLKPQQEGIKFQYLYDYMIIVIFCKTCQILLTILFT